MTMVDVTAGLNRFSFETGCTDEEKESLHLRARALKLTVSGCAQAVFLCKVVQSLRHSMAPKDERDLCVGILGMGNLGGQLLRSLIEKSCINPSNIKISSRRPESAVEPIQSGIEYFFNNSRLAAWADILFLCCLPSHLPKVCADLRSHLSKHCLVFSFTSAVPVKRLAHLLGHDFILKPQYDFVTDGPGDGCPQLTTALNDSLLIEASRPLTMRGGPSLGLNWVCAVLYSLLNICTLANLGSSDAICLINVILRKNEAHNVELNVQNLISASYASSLLPKEPFPWISLTDAQTKDTPLQRFLSSNQPMQQSISALFQSLLQN